MLHIIILFDSYNFNLILSFFEKFVCKIESGQKVTTPPPFRKLSTGNAFNVINVNSKVQAAAVAAVAAAQAQAAANRQNEDDAFNNTNSSSIQRSSSHESHLRNKIQQTPIVNHKQGKGLGKAVDSGENCASSGKLCLDDNNELGDKTSSSSNLKSGETMRRLSNEGSDYSSRGPSGNTFIYFNKLTDARFGFRKNSFARIF